MQDALALGRVAAIACTSVSVSCTRVSHEWLSHTVSSAERAEASPSQRQGEAVWSYHVPIVISPRVPCSGLS